MCTSHNLPVSKDSTLTPLDIKAPDRLEISFNGLSIPSNILPIMPGAKVTDMAAPVDITSCPGFRPVVSS